MSKYILLFLFIVPMLASAQQSKLKRRYLGDYSGTISGYEIVSGEEIFSVSSSEIQITIEKTQVKVTVEGNVVSGAYAIKFEADKYYLLAITVEGQLITELVKVYKHGKRLSREGIYPQPDVELNKEKRKR